MSDDKRKRSRRQNREPPESKEESDPRGMRSISRGAAWPDATLSERRAWSEEDMERLRRESDERKAGGAEGAKSLASVFGVGRGATHS